MATHEVIWWARIESDQVSAWKKSLEEDLGRKLTEKEWWDFQIDWTEIVQTMLEGRSPGRGRGGVAKRPPTDMRLEFNGLEFVSRRRPRRAASEPAATLEELQDKWNQAAYRFLRSVPDPD